MLICALCLGLAGAAAAESAILNTDYETLTEYYDLAIAAQEESDYKGAIAQLTDLISYYEQVASPGVKQYNDIPLYYHYALGRIELAKEEPNYQEAWSNLEKCGDGLYGIASYIQYARAMTEMRSGEYAAAITDLRAVQGVLKEFTSQCIEAQEECKALFKSSVLSKGKATCDKGDHEKAREYYSQFLELIPSDADVKALLAECEEKHNPLEPEEINLEVINAVATVPGSVRLTWKGNPEDYTVSWSSDLIHGKDTASAEVNGKTYTVNDLLPGTVYRFTISHKGSSVQIDRETRKAEEYPPAEGKDRFWTGSSSLYRFDNSRYDFLYSGKTSYDFSNDKSCKYLKNRTVELFDKPISESCILFMFTTFGVPEDIDGKPYELLLHINGVGTLREEGVFGEEKVCYNGSYIYVVVYDLFDQAVEDYSDLSGVTFRLDLLVDGRFVASADGTLQ